MSGIKYMKWVDRAFLGIGIGLLVYVVSRFPLHAIAEACLRLGPFVALTPLIALSWIACNTRALFILLEGEVPFRSLLWNRLVGDGYNALLPLAGFGGEPFKLRHLSTFVPASTALTALLRDRLIENAVGYLFTAVWLAASAGRFPLSSAVRGAIGAYIGIALGMCVVYVLMVVTRLPGHASAALIRMFRVPTEDTGLLPWPRLLSAASWYLAGRFIGLVEIGVLFGLLGLGFSPLSIGFTYSVLHAAGFASFAIPQGLGVFEGTSVYLFGVLGFPGALGIAFVFARRGRLLSVSLFGVLLHLATRVASPINPPFRERSSS